MLTPRTVLACIVCGPRCPLPPLGSPASLAHRQGRARCNMSGSSILPTLVKQQTVFLTGLRYSLDGQAVQCECNFRLPIRYWVLTSVAQPLELPVIDSVRA